MQPLQLAPPIYAGHLGLTPARPPRPPISKIVLVMSEAVVSTNSSHVMCTLTVPLLTSFAPT